MMTYDLINHCSGALPYTVAHLKGKSTVHYCGSWRWTLFILTSHLLYNGDEDKKVGTNEEEEETKTREKGSYILGFKFQHDLILNFSFPNSDIIFNV